MKILVQLFCLLLTSTSLSQSLDQTFNANGIITSSVANTRSSESIIYSEMQADGKMVYLGNYYENNSISGGLAGSFIARYNSDGTLDNTFNTCGYRIFKNDYLQSFNISTTAHNFNEFKIQIDGKIIVSIDSYLFRLNIDGSVDTSFGTNGCFAIPFNSYYIKIRIQPNNNKIVIFGYRSNIILRLNSDGTVDNTFDNDGFISTDGLNLWEGIYDIVIQNDGKIIFLGAKVSWVGSTANFYSFTARINDNGDIDNSFGMNGIATPILFNPFYNSNLLNLQYDGKIVLASMNTNITGVNNDLPFVIRYNIDGTLDTTFNNNGMLNINATFNQINDIRTLPDEKMLLLVNGQIINNNTYFPVFKIYKLNPDGSFDNSFASNGEFYSDTIYSDAKKINIKNDGSLIVSGSFINYTNNTDDPTLLHRLIDVKLSSSGILENTTIFNLKQNFNEYNGTIEQANGKIITFLNSNKLVRYNADGSIDTTFGINGNIDINNTFSNKIVKQPDGFFLLYQPNSTKIYRRNSDGIIDTSFGVGGELNLVNDGYFNEVHPTSDNKLLVLSTDYSYFIQKFNNNGTVDASFVLNDFDNFGLFGRFNFFDDNEGEIAQNLIIQSDNKIIIAVSLISSISSGFATGLIRLNPNGSLDTTFGTNGKIVIQENNYLLPKKICLLENDSFVINFDIGNGQTKLYKYDNNGTSDINFNNVSIPNDMYNNNDIIIQSDYKILKSTNVNNQFSIVRYDNMIGALDTTFGNNGIINTPIDLGANINQLTWLQNNSLLASGTSFDGTNEGIALARYVNLNLGILNFANQNGSIVIYPNPIHEEATFEYSLENNELVSVEIIDLQGKIVQTVFKNKELPQGNYKQNINVSNLVSSGIYILKFSSSKGSESIKIIKK